MRRKPEQNFRRFNRPTDKPPLSISLTEIVADASRTAAVTAPTNFIRSIIDRDLADGKYDGVVTRFPPEPNGYLHIGHAKSIHLNFGIARDYRGRCHLRFDDTNPTTEDIEYVESIKESVRWLGFDWNEHLYHASDYFGQLYDYAEQLIRDGKAYVDSQSEEQIRETRGTVTEPGRPSPFRERTAEENLDLFRRMRAGEFPDGAHVLRARIDMASPNMKMRDPLLYRIRHAHHYRTGDAWCIYPMYDWAHPLSDAIEDITHSLCTLEFETNRELYDWVVDNCRKPPRPHQYEFARLNLDYTVMSKRKLMQLVEKKLVSGWDDPRLPTIHGLRRRGVTPEAIRDFCERIGVTKTDSRVDLAMLEHAIRDDLNFRAPRVLCVLRPLKVTITNFDADRVEWIDAPYWPHDVPKEGTRPLPLTREIYIEREDFMEDPPPKFFRLAPGRRVRLRHAGILTCDEVLHDGATGEVVELRGTLEREGENNDAAKPRVKGTIHWVSAARGTPCSVNLYDRLFTVAEPDAEEDWLGHINPASSVRLEHAVIEPAVADDAPDARYQFERQGYFWRDPVDSTSDALVFNRIVTLKDTWAKMSQAEPSSAGAGAAPARAPKKSATAEATPQRRVEDDVEALAPASRTRFERYTRDLDIQVDDALLLASDEDLSIFFEEAVEAHPNAQGAANWIVNVVLGEVKSTAIAALPFRGRHIGELVKLIDEGAITSRIARDVFAEMLRSGEAPAAIVEKKGLSAMDDRDQLAAIVDRVVAASPQKVEEYRAGKKGLIGFFTGNVMRETGGRADPRMVKEMLEERLG
jgi:glutaminyl-tRNA synthetase